MTIKASYPTIEPTLSLDFANSKRLDPRVTFTRNSVGTYFDAAGVLRTAAVNEPRFDHDPATGESLGLLVEESRTNLWTYSEQFEVADWTKARSSIATNTIEAPNGTLTADTLIEDNTASATHQTTRTASVISGLSYTWSIYCKTAGRSHITLAFANQFPANSFADFNLSAGTIAGTGALGASNVRMQPAGDGWYRLSITATASSTATSSLVAYMNNGTSISYTGDGASGIYLWGAQLEAGAFPTSYIKTEGTTITRRADAAVMTGTNFSSWYRQSEGSFFACGNSFGSYGTGRALVGNQTNYFIYKHAVGAGAVYDGTNSLFSSTIPAWPSPVNFSMAYSATSQAMSVNGSTTVSGASNGFIGSTQLSIGGPRAAATELNGYIKRLLYWNTRLPDATLQALTAS